MQECNRFVGRLKDLCEGKGHDGRPDPEPFFSAAFRTSHNLTPLHSAGQIQDSKHRTMVGGVDLDAASENVEMHASLPIAYASDEILAQYAQYSANPIRQNPVNPPPLPSRKTGNAGDKLKAIFESLQIKLPVCAPCQDAVLKMNHLLPEECRLKKDDFMEGIRNRAKQVTTASYIFGAIASVFSGLAFQINPLDPISSMYDMAVNQAEEELRQNGREQA